MRVFWAAAAAALVLSGVSGCSTTTSGTASKASTAATRTPQPTTTAPSAPTSGSLPASAAPTEEQLQTLLLRASDVGVAFTDGTYTKLDRPMLCAAAGSPSFRQQTSPQVDVGSELDLASPQAALTEQIFVYVDAATARAALTVAKGGLDCSSGTSYNDDGTTTPITVGTPADVSTDLAVDSGFAWQLKTATVQGSAIAVVLGRVIVTLSFAAVAGADTSKLPNVLAVAKTAIDKIKNS